MPMLNYWHFIILGSLAMLLGAALVLKGIWPRRTGHAPHCRRCGYNLTGLTGAICPECGRALNAAGTVQGQRKRRPSRIVSGLLLLLIGALGPASLLIDANWYPYLPSFWLIADLSSPARSAAAWQELMKRENAGGLGGWSRSRLIDACLAAQGTSPLGPLAIQQVEYLGSCWRNKRLAQAQADKFLRQMVTPELKIRQRVRVGSSAPWEVTGRRCMPKAFLYQLSKARILDNSRVAVEEQRHLAQIQQDSYGHTAWTVRCEQAGRHDVTLEATAEIYIDPYGPGVTNMTGPQPQGQPCIRFPVKLTASYEGIPAEAADIRLVANPSLQDPIRNLQRPMTLVIDEGYDVRTKRRCRMLKMGSWQSSGFLPANVAFKVYARIDRQEYEIGEATGEQGGGTSWNCPGTAYNGAAPKTIDVVLRASEQAACATLNVYEIWNGEITYENVPVIGDLAPEQEPQAHAASASQQQAEN